MINLQFVDADRFSEGMAAVEFAAGGKAGANWGYIDLAGKVTIGPRFLRASRFVDGLAVAHSRGQGGLINKQGAFVDHCGNLR